jgi:hypothetical protein
MTRLVQLQHGHERHVGLVEEPRVRLLRDITSVYAVAQTAITSGKGLVELARQHASGDYLDYESIHAGRGDWRLLVPFDHPDEPARCLVSGTGLTHLGSAKNRQAMHEAPASDLTDSMKMFRWGVESGRPEPGQIGVAPEWFYKGDGSILRAHGEPLSVPAYAEDGGEEAEIAALYLVGPNGQPWRVGMCTGNEFSDHCFEKKNYLNLAGSKIRTCALGPELTLDPDFRSVEGKVSICRGGRTIWSKAIRTGEAEMCHSLGNIEHHHFKFETHRRPGDAHVHYLGACSLSFGDGIKLEHGDVMEMNFEGFGRPLCNPLSVHPPPAALVAVKTCV